MTCPRVATCRRPDSSPDGPTAQTRRLAGKAAGLYFIIVSLLFSLVCLCSWPPLCASAPDETSRFQLTAGDIKLLRTLVIGWNPCESGAPGVDPLRTFHLKSESGDLLSGLADFFQIKPSGSGNFPNDKKEEIERTQEHFFKAFSVFLDHAHLKPGRYKIKNRLKEIYPDGKYKLDANGSDFRKIPLTDTIEFDFTDDYAKLIKHANCDYLGLDPKRPYGDMTYFEIDMADALGIPVERDASGKPLFTEAQLKHFDDLHWNMIYALQVFLENAAIKPGSY